MSRFPVFVLASASPARRQLLLSAGIDPLVQQSNFDESQIHHTDSRRLVEALALAKAQTVAATLPSNSLILGCDSLLSLGGVTYGKPATPADAIARWQAMRGQTGELLTGHALLDLTQEREIVRCQVTQVDFAQISDHQIETYVATGEPLRCAGCFALDGMGGLFVNRIVGCHSNIIGLSLPLLREMLAELGYDITSFWPVRR